MKYIIQKLTVNTLYHFYTGLMFIASFIASCNSKSLSVLFLCTFGFLHGHYTDFPCLSFCCLEKMKRKESGKTHFLRDSEWIHLFLETLRKHQPNNGSLYCLGVLLMIYPLRPWFSTWLAVLTQSPPLLNSVLYFKSDFTNKWSNFYAN